MRRGRGPIAPRYTPLGPVAATCESTYSQVATTLPAPAIYQALYRLLHSEYAVLTTKQESNVFLVCALMASLSHILNFGTAWGPDFHPTTLVLYKKESGDPIG